MGLFTSRKVEWRRGMQNDVGCRNEWNQLAALMGRENAKKFLELVYDWGIARQCLNIVDAAMVKSFCEKERDNFTFRRTYYNQLAVDCRAGTLRAELNGALRPTASYYLNPAGGGAMTARETAIDQAANWICGTYVPALGSTRALLREYIPVNAGHHGKAGGALGNTPNHLIKIHKKLVPNAAPWRFNYTAGPVRYPSTVGGMVLLDEIMRTTGNTAWPAFGAVEWEDIAMFYLTSIVTVQGFTDGNKRTGHFAYAMVLIKGTHAFKAPTSAKETALFRMNG